MLVALLWLARRWTGGMVSDPTQDSEIDFDDERDDDQLPLDEVEAQEIGADLDDPDEVADEDDIA